MEIHHNGHFEVRDLHHWWPVLAYHDIRTDALAHFGKPPRAVERYRCIFRERPSLGTRFRHGVGDIVTAAPQSFSETPGPKSRARCRKPGKWKTVRTHD